MHTVEETASLLAARAPFSLFPTSKDDGSQGHFVSLWRRAILSLMGKEEGNLDKFIEDIMAMSIKHTFNKSSLGNSSNVDRFTVLTGFSRHSHILVIIRALYVAELFKLHNSLIWEI